MSDKICSVCGVVNPKYGYNTPTYGYLCNKHYVQLKRHGKFISTKYDPNKIEIFKDHAEIIIGKFNVKIPLDKVQEVSKYKWCVNSYGYVVSVSYGIWLHRLIMDAPEDKLVDHINGDTLNNQYYNLRLCSASENNMNKGLQSNNTSGVTGVVYHKHSDKWCSRIKVNGKHIHLGLFKEKEEAIRVRKEAEIKYFGEFRRVTQYE